MGRQEECLLGHASLGEEPSRKPYSLYKYEINNACDMRPRLQLSFLK